jgi:hypothetical protein
MNGQWAMGRDGRDLFVEPNDAARGSHEQTMQIIRIRIIRI